MSERLEDILEGRKKKLQEIKQAGLEPYTSSTGRTHSNKEALEGFDSLNSKPITLVGRVRSWRDMGKIIFAHIEDGSGKIQVLIKSEDLGADNFKFILKHIDIGDFVEFTGTLFKTKTEEKTLQASGYKMLAKSLRPLPSEHFGLADEETKLRKRYLDILMDPAVKETFVKKNLFWSSTREFLVKKGFLELEMPVLEAVPGGAEAEPFVTHHNALGRDFYLRISLELPLKKMLVAGYEKVFEIGRIFRNEGISTEHLQDYTQMEFYWAYGDFEQLMDFSKEMYQYVIAETFGTLKISHDGKEVDWSGEWEKVDYVKLFEKHTGINPLDASEDELQKYADKNKISYEPFAKKGRLIDLIFKKAVRTTLSDSKPIFLINQPIELEPLAKRDPKNPKVVQRMQILAYGTELGKGFGELNDPIDQRERFAAQMALRDAGDSEAQMLDEDYMEAMEYGMPPAAGFGLSERLFAVLSDKSVRETVIFPAMKEVLDATKTGKAKETLIAVAAINKGAKLEAWQEMNTVAHLNAEFGIHQGKKLLLQDEITTKDGKQIKLNPQHAIMIKTAGSSNELQKLSASAKEMGLEVSEFIREMIETTDDKKVISAVKSKKLTDVEYLGVLIFGKKKEVESLTKHLELYK
ncbi:MAG TPA: lysine--tRNA ligase [Candidatus Limnocylindria bacterium]|nr:lysine--tRNA ligase [Candidatus Limnocylindria bacterium]